MACSPQATLLPEDCSNTLCSNLLCKTLLCNIGEVTKLSRPIDSPVKGEYEYLTYLHVQAWIGGQGVMSS